MSRLTLILPILERDALFRLARREARDPRAQAALIIRTELERLGLLERSHLERVLIPSPPKTGGERT